MLIIGRNPVLEALKFNSESVKKLILLDSLTDNKLNEIAEKAKSKNIIVERQPKKTFEKLFDKENKSEGISQGIIAEVDDFVYFKTTGILKSKEGQKTITLVILDEIQDPHNFGAIIRTAAAAGIDGIIISDKNSVKVNHTVVKTSAGAVNHVKISKEANIYKTIEKLKEYGFKIIGTVTNTNEELYNFQFPDKCGIVFGGEGMGLRKNILNLCDNLIKIPMAERIESLNVSVSAGIVLYERMRQNFNKT
ncbi:MAG TPA: 23S rRNA (guanosine(2251)-2'-O)-methyltransferase RlmB [Ignavibacteria bacterium]|jgi:23S rRNA (guanosine2251-2'-O)-methyltransferase